MGPMLMSKIGSLKLEISLKSETTFSYNITPLLTAASIGFMDACELLIDAGADINYIPEGITLALYKNLL